MHHSSATTFRLLLVMALFVPFSVLFAERPVMTVAEARAHLTRNDFHQPVRVRGVVTFSNQRMGLAYVQDASGGIGFDPRSKTVELPLMGKTVEVEGYLSRRHGMVMLLKHRTEFGVPLIAAVGDEKPPTPLNFELNNASQMRIDGLLTKVSGVVRRVVVPPVEGAPMVVEISSANGYALARLPWREAQPVLDRWINMPVTLKAVLVCRAEPPVLPADADALLLVPSRGDWTVQETALERVFKQAPIKAATAIQATPRNTVWQRVNVVGTVTAAKPRAWVCLRTEDGSIEVATRQTDVFVPGQKLAIACWPQNQSGRLTLQDGICRVLESGPTPPPIRLEQGFFHPRMQRELVEVTGILHTHSLPGGSPRFTLSLPSGVSCLLAWGPFIKPNQIRDLEDGSRLRLTGLCHITNSEGENLEGASLSILPRSMEDITVLAGPSWWTLQRLKLAVWWLLALVGLALPGALIFRWQLWKQSQRIREIESRAATEEERLRIAREFHDCLQQQLTSAALHLETLKGAMQAAPEMLPRLIDDTTAMLRHCQVEARHCIWDLRSEAEVRDSLTKSLDDWLNNRIQPGTHTRVEFTREGPEPALPDGVPFQLMRITQEAVANALAHSAATCIRVHLQTSRKHLKLDIEDNGQGFEARLLSNPPPGHFGLSGLKERAAKIGARLEFQTNPGTGTCVSIHLSLSALKHESCA